MKGLTREQQTAKAKEEKILAEIREFEGGVAVNMKEIKKLSEKLKDSAGIGLGEIQSIKENLYTLQLEVGRWRRRIARRRQMEFKFTTLHEVTI